MPYFTGELMTCCVCRATERSDPHVSTQWRVIVVDDVPFYACPREFPDDGAPAGAFEGAYRRVMLHIVALRQASPGVHYAN
jgi:hypothetical protein